MVFMVRIPDFVPSRFIEKHSNLKIKLRNQHPTGQASQCKSETDSEFPDLYRRYS